MVSPAVAGPCVLDKVTKKKTTLVSGRDQGRKRGNLIFFFFQNFFQAFRPTHPGIDDENPTHQSSLSVFIVYGFARRTSGERPTRLARRSIRLRSLAGRRRRSEKVQGRTAGLRTDCRCSALLNNSKYGLRAPLQLS